MTNPAARRIAPERTAAANRWSPPFLTLPPTSWVASNSLAFAVRDQHPVSPGHTLVITRRPVATRFDATRDEQIAILGLIDEVRRDLEATHHPDGWNIGINVAAAGGQTVPHLHVHVIPRYRGDVPDPRGGVRHVIPARANYLRDRPLATGGHADPFLRHLRPLFARAADVAIIAAFVQDSGLDVLHDAVFAALARGARVRLITGDYLDLTQAAALRRLLDWANASGAREDGEPRGRFEVRVVEVAENELVSFHPKSWRFAPRAVRTLRPPGRRRLREHPVAEPALRSRGAGGRRADAGADGAPPAAWDDRSSSARIPHARFVERCLREWGVRAACVHSEPDSADRDETLERLARGDLGAVCSVDLFNEGIDVPAIGRVVMLRPTESPVVFLQQLGRGLRRAAGKERLVVIDFAGNHRAFLDRLRLLVTLGPSPMTLREFLVDGRVPDLPEGCSVDVELEAIDMLRRLLPSGATEVERAYRELRAAREIRPTAGELERMGYRVATLRAVHGSWFDFVAGEGDIDEAERVG